MFKLIGTISKIFWVYEYDTVSSSCSKWPEKFFFFFFLICDVYQLLNLPKVYLSFITITASNHKVQVLIGCQSAHIIEIAEIFKN